jgi:hypothetical protein
VAIAPDGSWLATASFDDTVRIWDAASGQERAALTGHKYGVWAVAIAPDGTWLATGSDQTVRIWDAVTGQQRAALAANVRCGQVHSWTPRPATTSYRYHMTIDHRPASTPRLAVRAPSRRRRGAGRTGQRAVRSWLAADQAVTLVRSG